MTAPPLPPALTGMLAALADETEDLNPYTEDEDRREWLCGHQVVHTFAQARVDRALELHRHLAEGLGPDGVASLAPVQPMTEAARHRFVVLTHMLVAQSRLIGERDTAQARGDQTRARAYNHAVNIISQEHQAARKVGQL